MDDEEAAVFVKEWENREKEEWERQRLNMWASFQPLCSEPIRPQDLFQLPWEKSEKEQGPTQEEIKIAFANARAIRDKIFNNGGDNNQTAP